MENTDTNQAPQLREDAVSGSVTASNACIIESFKQYRHETNPKEKELHDKFLENHILYKDCAIDLLVFPPANNSQTYAIDTLSKRELSIMLGTIQWLGSPVGQYFLFECGFSLTDR